jgi:protein-tyrosine phosphatase
MRESSARIRKGLSVAIAAIGAWALANPLFCNEIPYERVIDLQGTSNTRDIGGYATSDGHVLRWRQILRSDRLSKLTPEDFRKLEDIGVKTVIDLRTDREQEQEPTVWLGEHPPRILHFPIGDARDEWFNAQRRLLKGNRFTEEQALRHMVAGYQNFVEAGEESLRQTMEVVLDPANWPVLIHCSAGKDRSGIAVSLILEALGVDREAIMQDYLLTNEVSHTRQKAALLARERSNSRSVGRGRTGASAEAWFPIVGVEPEMLNAFYADIDEHFGSVYAYLDELGVDQSARRALAAALTTEQQPAAQALTLSIAGISLHE